MGAAAVTTIAVAGLLAAERFDSRTWRAVFKPVASTGFVAAALACGALDSDYGRWILAGLACSWWGDVLLIPESNEKVFLSGVVAFLLGHVAYAIAFLGLGFDARAGFTTAAAVVLVAVVVMRYLRPHVPAEMKAAVAAYVAVISTMVVTAAAAAGAIGPAAWTVVAGALGFYLSDLAVARDRFVVRSFVNRAWGLPLYYGAQLVLAVSVRAVGVPGGP